MNPARRRFLRGTVSSATLAVAVSAGLLRPRQAFAYPVIIDLKGMEEVLRSLSTSRPPPSENIRVLVPDVAMDGANVYLGISSTLPAVDVLAVFVEKNPQPFIAAFRLGPQTLPEVKILIKVSQTSPVWVVARSEGSFYRAARQVKVTVGGCGVGVN